MSQGANRPSTRQQVIENTSVLVGLPLTASRRAADLRTLQFGTLRQVPGGSVGDFALHIQCPWRLDRRGNIITGRLDLWEPEAPDAEINNATWDYERSPNLQDARFVQLMAEHSPALFVSNVDADECGGVAIKFLDGITLRLFPSGSRGEDWRLFRPGRGGPHFVIAGGLVSERRGSAL